MQNFNEKYNLFFSEAKKPKSQIPSINKINAVFKQISTEELISLMHLVYEKHGYETFNLLLHYIILFRDMKNIQDWINSEKFPVDYLEKLVLFTHGYCILYDYTLERVLDEILHFIDKKRLLELALYSQFITRDKLLLFFILSKFDTEMLNQYFMRISNVSEFIDYFLRLPEEIMRSIITRNYKLFQYIMILVAEHDYNQTYTENFFDKYREDIDQFSRLSDVIRDYKKSSDIAEEKKLPLNKRTMSRISFIVNKIREMPNAEKAIEYFNSENIFVDDAEKQVVTAIIYNPLFKNVFKYIGK